MSLAHAASVFGIFEGKSAVQNIVLGGPYDPLLLIYFTHHASARDYSDGEIMLLRRQNFPVAKLVIDIKSSNDMCLLQLHIGIKNHHSTDNLLTRLTLPRRIEPFYSGSKWATSTFED